MKEKNNIGAITWRENWRETLKAEYADVFFNVGEILGATGKRSIIIMLVI